MLVYKSLLEIILLLQVELIQVLFDHITVTPLHCEVLLFMPKSALFNSDEYAEEENENQPKKSLLDVCGSVGIIMY